MKPNGTTLMSFDYGLDPVGNRTRVIDGYRGSRTTWSYDATYQLTAERRTGYAAFTVTHAYDAAGNRLKRHWYASSPKTFTYDAANQLQTCKTGTGTTTYVYDAAGNLRSQRSPGIATYTWDAENRLTRVQTPVGGIITMVYRPDGLRVRKEDSSATKKFVWDAERMLLETDAGDVTQAAYTLAPGEFGPLVSLRRSGSSRFYHLDGLGSAAGLTDSSGQSPNNSYIYDAYGELVTSGEDTVNYFRFVGGLGYYYECPMSEYSDHIDAFVDQYYVRARHYDPFLGRWLSRDPLALARSDVNLYRYVRNAGPNATDPTGLQVDDPYDPGWIEQAPGVGTRPGSIVIVRPRPVPLPIRGACINCHGSRYIVGAAEEGNELGLPHARPTGPCEPDIVSKIIAEAERRRRTKSPGDDSAHHCWAVCTAGRNSLLIGGVATALIGCVVEALHASSDWAEDMLQNWKGAYCACRLDITCDTCCGTYRR